MANYRHVHTSFWQDAKVLEEMTPEDKYFYLYLLTNPNTTQIGVYQITKKQMAFDLGYSIETVNSLMQRFETVHNLIRYNPETREIAILNWGKYNLHKAGKPVLDCVNKELKGVKDRSLLKLVAKKIPNEEILKLFLRYVDDTSHDTLDDTYHDTYNDTLTTRTTTSGEKEKQKEKQKEKDNDIPFVDIIDYLNAKANTNYRHTTKKTQQLIRARWNEGFRLDDFKTVIDKKVAEWLNDPKMCKYLRPETLFGTKFESYLNQKEGGWQRAIDQPDTPTSSETESNVREAIERRKRIAKSILDSEDNSPF
jgi:uncharacterized phage protein (TIGR02220 family)